MKKFFSSIKTTRGFTLIELLIVVAIIGILSAVVLTSLGSARTKAVEAKVKSQMASLRTQAELYASSNTTNPNTYTGLDTTGVSTSAASNGIKEIVEALRKDTGSNPIIKADPNRWAAFVTLPATGGATGALYCVDSNGFAGTPTTSPGALSCQ